jgi:hypothetical protein
MAKKVIRVGDIDLDDYRRVEDVHAYARRRGISLGQAVVELCDCGLSNVVTD